MINGSRIGSLQWAGAYDGTHTFNRGASIAAFATENWTSAANGTQLQFSIVSAGTLTRNTVLTLGSDSSALFTGQITGNILSGGTIISGSTNLYNIFAPINLSKLDFQVIASGDTNTLTTSSTSFVDVPGMSANTHNLGTSNTTYKIMFNCEVYNTTASDSITFQLVSGNTPTVLSGTVRTTKMTATASQNLNLTTMGFATSVPSGTTFKVQWKVNAGTGTISGRTFSILGTPTNNVV